MSSAPSWQVWANTQPIFGNVFVEQDASFGIAQDASFPTVGKSIDSNDPDGRVRAKPAVSTARAIMFNLSVHQRLVDTLRQEYSNEIAELNSQLYCHDSQDD
jgi:hypothetical protein